MKKIILVSLVFCGIINSMDNTLNKVILDGQAIDEFMSSMRTTLDTCKQLPAENKAVAFYNGLTGWVQSYKNDTYNAYFPHETRSVVDALFDAHTNDNQFNTLYEQAKNTNTLESWNTFRLSSYQIGKKILESKGVKFQPNPQARSYEDFIKANHDIQDSSKPWLLAGTVILFYVRQMQRVEFGSCPEIPKK